MRIWRPWRLLVALSGAFICVPGWGNEHAGYTGSGLYRAYCASCHGLKGKGDGPVASSLRVSVPDLTRIAAREGGSFPVEQVRQIIDGRTPVAAHGSPAMPVWGLEFRDDLTKQKHVRELVDLLVDYLRSVQEP
jgi:mono/diheme cytochrome c family protein